MTLEDEFLKSKTEEPQNKTLNIKLGVKLKKVPPGAKLKDVKALFRGFPVKNIIFQRGAAALVVLGSQEAVDKALAMKKATLGRHTVLVRPLPREFGAPGKSGKDGAFKREFFPQRDQKAMEKEVEETGRLFFRNLAYEVSETELDALCAPFGLLAEAFVPWDVAMKRNRGFGFVTFVHPAEAVRAFRALDKKEIHGRKLHILPGKEATKEADTEDEEEGGEGNDKTAFQRERLAKRKRTEGTAAAERTWNPLLINAAALAEVQAAELGVSKEQLLDSRTKGSAAVRLAQLELALIGELEEFLKEEKAHVPSLRGQEEKKGVVIRSRNAFLVKNLPAFSKKEELEPLLSRHGDLEALKMAPKGLLAIAYFRQSVQARRAFAHLAFAEFKDSVLKVEWLPQLQTEFAEEETEAEEQEESSPPKKAKIDKETVSKKRKKTKEDEAEDDVEPQDRKKRKHSKKAVEEVEETEAEVSPKKTKNKSEKIASRLADEEQVLTKKAEKALRKAEKASKKAKAKSIEEQAESKEYEKAASKKAEAKSKKAEAKSKKAEELAEKAEAKSEKAEAKSKKAEAVSEKAEAKSKKAEAKSKKAEAFAEKAEAKSEKAEAKSKKAEAKSKKAEAVSEKAEAVSKKTEAKSKKAEAAPKEAEAGRSTTVVLVRNVPFQASRRELEELCRPFGALVRVRLPVKAGGGIRGFAFAEFADEESAQAFLAADQRMHLYGRRLRLEAALTDAAVSSAREKALASLTGGLEAEAQRKRKAKVRLEPELPPEAL